MKVLQINSVCGYGSTGRIATDLYDTLREQGHDCVIAYGRGKAPESYKTIRIGNDWDVICNGIKTRLTDMEGFGARKATRKFVEQIIAYNPDIIHLHNLHGYYINIEILFNYLAKANKPVIWTLHDCWAFTGHCSYFDYIGCDKWKTGCHNCPQKKEYPKSLLSDNSIWNYKKKEELFTSVQKMTIVTPSKWLAGMVEKSFLKNCKVKVIHNGVDLDGFKPTPSDFKERYHCENKIIVLGVAGVWDRRKGLDTFVRLANDLPKDTFQVIVVGLTKKQIKQMPKQIIAIERTNSIRELTEAYTAACVFVNPTLEDNFPTTNLEALACGTSVITYNTGGSSEMINENCGVVVKKNDYELLKNIILNNIIIKKEKCCITCLSKINKKLRYSEYINLFKKMLINTEKYMQ